MPSRFVLDSEVGAELLGFLGVERCETVEDVVEVLEAAGRVLPGGTMARHAALACGEVPPGPEIDVLAERILAGERSSWSCHVRAALLAGVVNSVPGSRLLAGVDLWQRCDEGAAAVDLHTTLRVWDGEVSYVCESYFGGPLLPWPGTDGRSTRWRPGRELEVRRSGSGAVELVVRGAELSRELHYRHVVEQCTPELVSVVCAISATHTGVGAERGARRLLPDGVVRLEEHEGGGKVRISTQSHPGEGAVVREEVWGCYQEAYDAWFPAGELNGGR